MNETPANYAAIISSLKEKIKSARLKAVTAVNTELLKVYWEIGSTILSQQKVEGWGSKIIDRLSADLKSEFPELQGLSIRNLKYMRSFAQAYPLFGIVQQPAALNSGVETQTVIIVQQLAAQIPWGHHQLLMDKIKDETQSLFYMQKIVENGWTRDVLAHMIETRIYDRTGKAITNFKNRLPADQSELAQQSIKSPYIFDFLGFSEEVKEKELEKALIIHLQKFMLELGKGFAWVGNQKNLVVNGDDFFLDLLFYNYNMHCFVVFELKVSEFKPEFAGKLNFYVNTIDAQLKGINDKPTIGVLLCKTPNETVVKYSLKGIESPIGVTNYQFEKALPAELKNELPTLEELEQEIEQSYEEFKKPADKKLDQLKVLLKNLKEPEINEQRSAATVQRFFETLLPDMKNRMVKRYQTIHSMFQETSIHIYVDSQGFRDYKDAEKELRDRKHYSAQKLDIDLQHNGFRKAGTKAFSCRSSISIELHEYKYKIVSGRTETVLLEKLYREMPTDEDQDMLVEGWFEDLLDDIAKQVKLLNAD